MVHDLLHVARQNKNGIDCTSSYVKSM